MSTYVFVVISPATTTSPVVISVSQATRPSGSSARTTSRTESEIWSAILSGCPSVTDSELNWNDLPDIARQGIAGLLAGADGALEEQTAAVDLRVQGERVDSGQRGNDLLQRRGVRARARARRGRGDRVEQRRQALHVDVGEACRRVREPDVARSLLEL